MKIIEFCGSPGCGKSTLCDALEKILKQRQYKTINLQKEEKAKNIWQKFRKAINIYIFPFIYCNASCNKNLRANLSQLSVTHNEKYKSVWCRRILKINYLLQKAIKQNYDYILFDEGFIQFLTSLADGIEINEEHKTLVRFFIKTIYLGEYRIFNCKVTTDENIRRLKKRNRINDSFLLDNDEEMKVKLNGKIENIESCVALFPAGKVVNLDMNSFELTLQKILEYI